MTGGGGEDGAGSARTCLIPYLTALVRLSALALSGIGLARAQEAPAVENVEKAGAHFVVRCHGGDDTLAGKALDAVEAVWPTATAILGGERAPGTPLVVHLYRTIAGYEAAEQEVTSGKFRRNLAMTSDRTHESHVALQPPCRDEALRAIGLPGQTAALLAWEATHLVRTHLLPNFADHPMWFVDGFAAYVSAQVLEKLHPCGGTANAPFSATRQGLVQRLLQDRKLPKIADILGDRIDELDIHPRYAVRAVFFEFLAGDPKGRLAKVVDLVRRTGGGAKYKAEVPAGAGKILGANADQDFEKFVRGLQPKWFEYFRSLTAGGTEWQQLAFADTNAVAWSTEPVKGGAIAASGMLRILPGDCQQLNFLFARDADGFVSVAFTADQGFTVFDYQEHRAGDAWHEIGKANAPSLRLGYASKFQVQAKGRSLEIHLDEQHWEFTLLRPLPAEVAWGLGAQAGSAGIWNEVKASQQKP
jgi:hypothetical protein